MANGGVNVFDVNVFDMNDMTRIRVVCVQVVADSDR